MIARVGLCCLLSTGAIFAQVSRIENTPHLLQEGFGPHGEYLPNDGREYCVPTSWTMAMYWLRADGFKRAAPAFNRRAALSTDLAIAGLYGTTPGGGTVPVSGTGTQPKILTYLRLRGLGEATFKTFRRPTLDDLREGLIGNRIGVINIAWVSSTTFERTGGHNVTLVAINVDAQGNPEPGMVAINNPMAPATQFSPTEELMMPSPWGTRLVFTGGVVGKNPAVIPVIDGFSYVDPGPIDQPLAEYRSIRHVVLDAVDGSFEVLAPLVGSKGLIKRGDGEVVLTTRSRSIYRGRTKIEGGRLVSLAANGLVCGRGDVLIAGGELAVRPRQARAKLGGRGRTVTFEGGTLSLEPRGDEALRLEIGGTLRRGHAGSLVLAPRRGLDDLGVGTLFVSTNDDGAILGGERDGSGDFLVPSGSGLVRANVPFVHLADRQRWAMAAVNGEQRLTDETRVHSLRLDAADVGGAGTLRIAAEHGEGVAAIILNNSRVSTRLMIFDADETIVYASRAGGRIDARLEGRGDLIVTGPGRLTLRGANFRTGATTVSGAILAIESAETGVTGPIAIRADATLTGNGRLGGRIAVDGTLLAGDSRGGLRTNGDVVFGPEARLVWRLTQTTEGREGAGFGWSYLEAGGAMQFPGNGTDFQTLGLEFLNGTFPNAKDAFWKKPRRWLIARADGPLDATGLDIQNPRFEAGQFTIEATKHELFLVFAPTGP